MNKRDDVISAADDVMSVVTEVCRDKGLECHSFKVGWYNERVTDVFHLPYPPVTLAVLVVSTPSMFELLFKPYLISSSAAHIRSDRLLDPLDQCLRNQFDVIKDQFATRQVIDAIQDFELHPTRRPKLLVQTAGHVAGAARFYQRGDVTPDPWSEGKRIYGVSVHPKYGGWFALRGALIFRDVMAPELERREPIDCVPTCEMRIELLEKFNDSWRDWKYRDVSDSEIRERYSEEQKTYFGTEPSKRNDIISAMLQHDSTLHK